MKRLFNFKEKPIKSTLLLFVFGVVIASVVTFLNMVASKHAPYVLSPFFHDFFLGVGALSLLGLVGTLFFAATKYFISSKKLKSGASIGLSLVTSLVGVAVVLVMGYILLILFAFSAYGHYTTVEQHGERYYYYNAGFMDPEYRLHEYVNPLMMKSDYHIERSDPKPES